MPIKRPFRTPFNRKISPTQDAGVNDRQRGRERPTEARERPLGWYDDLVGKVVRILVGRETGTQTHNK